MQRAIVLAVVAVAYGSISASAFVPRTSTRFETRQCSFFKDLIDKAFENDGNISQSDKRTGQLEGPGDDQVVSVNSRDDLTDTQRKWREMNARMGSLEGSSFLFDFFLAGVPNKDPSNDLFGSKENISMRDRATGLNVPAEPTVGKVKISFLPDKKCRCETATDFTEVGEGDYLLSDDQKQVRFRINVSGYTRRVETKGSIQSVYWSDAPDKTTSSQTVYTIPEGWLYGEAVLSSNARGNVQWEDGVLKIEQSAGLLGAGSKMVPCGKFTATMVSEAVESKI